MAAALLLHSKLSASGHLMCKTLSSCCSGPSSPPEPFFSTSGSIQSEDFHTPLPAQPWQLASALGGYLLIVCGVFPRKCPPNPSQAVYKLAPAALATSGTLFAGNYAYLTLSIAFMQVRVACLVLLSSATFWHWVECHRIKSTWLDHPSSTHCSVYRQV
jgi:hypothetical protein